MMLQKTLLSLSLSFLAGGAIFFRRQIKSEDKYLLVCNNNRTTVSDPVISADSILSIAPVVLH